MTARWFVYFVFDGCRLLYVGKGSGSRWLVSAKRLNGIAGIVRYFDTESQALKAEKRYIADLNPPANKTAGGEGKSKRRRGFDYARKWRNDAFDRAARPGSSWIDKLLSECYRRCEANELKRLANT